MFDTPPPAQHYEMHITEAHRHSSVPKNRVASESLYSQQACYFDIGGLGTSIWNFIHWVQPSPDVGYEQFDVAGFTEYLTSLFTQMRNAGMDQINLCFAQLSDINAFAEGNFSQISSSDSIGALLQQMVTNEVHFPEGTNLFNLVTETALHQNIKTALSFGGETASYADFTLCKQGETPQGQAEKLLSIMEKYALSAIDFDVEGSNAKVFTEQEGILPFFAKLHQTLSTQGKQITLTIQGSLRETVWGTGHPKQGPKSYNGPLRLFFYNQQNQPIFTMLFTGLNLMMYDSGKKYYLDSKAYPGDTIIPDWSIEDWLAIVGAKNASLVHLGFQDATPYQSPHASASGHTYSDKKDPLSPLSVTSTDSPGVAAAKILLHIEQQLLQDGYQTPLASPFWWPDYDDKRYQNGPHNKAQFISPTMFDFYKTLQTLGPKEH